MKQIIHKINYILTRQERKKIWFLFVLMVIGGFLELLGVAGIFPLMDKLIGGDVSDIRSIIFLAIILMVIYIAKNLFLLFMYRTIYHFVYDGRSKLSTRLFSVYMTEPYAFHLNRNIAIIQRAVRSDVDGFYNLVKALLQMMSEIIICIVLSVLLFMTDYKMAAILVILLGTCVGSVLIVSKKKVRILGAEDMTYNAGMNQWLLQGIGGIKEIKLLKKENYFLEKFQVLSQKSSMNQRKQQLLIQTPRLLTETVSILAVLIWIVIAAVSHTNLMETIPTLAVFAVAAFRLLPSVGKINGLLTEYHFYKSRVDFIYEDLNELEQCSVNLQNNNDNVPGTDLRMNFQREIQVKHISFSYANSERKILDDVSFSIPVGASIGIVGPSGAGKTTLVDIIMGLLEIKSGDIMVDGKSIYENLSGWYDLIGYVPQVIYLSDDSIKKNIAFGVPEEEIDVDKVNEVIRKAQMYDFISDMPDGIDTMIGDRGIRLSGGQRQRIGIARALYHNPEILILDEATSSLDNETESAVMNAIEALYGKVTMLVIAHRLTTIQSCDKIFHVEHGHVIQKEK